MCGFVVGMKSSVFGFLGVSGSLTFGNFILGSGSVAGVSLTPLTEAISSS